MFFSDKPKRIYAKTVVDIPLLEIQPLSQERISVEPLGVYGGKDDDGEGEMGRKG
jgi:hypothetical protein